MRVQILLIGVCCYALFSGEGYTRVYLSSGDYIAALNNNPTTDTVVRENHVRSVCERAIASGDELPDVRSSALLRFGASLILQQVPTTDFQNDLQRGLQLIQEYLSTQPPDPFLGYSLRAKALARLGKGDEAAEDLNAIEREALGRNRENIAWLWAETKATLLMSQGKSLKSIFDFMLTYSEKHPKTITGSVAARYGFSILPPKEATSGEAMRAREILAKYHPESADAKAMAEIVDRVKAREASFKALSDSTSKPARKPKVTSGREDGNQGGCGTSCGSGISASAPASQPSEDACGCGGDAAAAPAATPAADSCCAPPATPAVP